VIHDTFLSFVPFTPTTEEALEDCILTNFLSQLELALHDGSNMNGTYRGVQARSGHTASFSDLKALL